MSNIIILKDITDTMSISKFKFNEQLIEVIKLTEKFNTYFKIEENKKNFFIRFINKIRKKYYKFLIVHKLREIVKEDSKIILSKSLQRKYYEIKEILDFYMNKYNIKCKVVNEKYNITKLVPIYIKENFQNIHELNIALILKDSSKIDKKMYIELSKIAKKVDIITSKKLPKQNRLNKLIEDVNMEYGTFNDLKQNRNLNEYKIVINEDKKFEELELYKFNNKTLYIDIENILTSQDYNFLNTHNIKKWIDKENINILKYNNLLNDENLFKNISFLSSENEIYISELLNILNDLVN